MKNFIKGNIVGFLISLPLLAGASFLPEETHLYIAQLDEIEAKALEIKATLEAMTEKERIMAKIDDIADEYGLARHELHHIVFCESSYNPRAKAVNEWEESYGLVQINVRAWKITREQAEDPDFALNFLATEWKKGNYQWWKNCSKKIGVL